MAYKPLIILGTGSHVGKTTIVAGLCRLFANRGLKVAPFKAQNMSLNSFATLNGEEIARATAVQSLAAKQVPSVHMNPILLKPQNDIESQLILHGKAARTITAQQYFNSREHYSQKLEVIKTSIKALQSSFDLIIAEGAGSCAEPNFLSHDLVNLGLAHLLDADAYLVVDIDQGGAFANILGTLRILELLAPEYSQRIKGILLNKFRGDPAILQPAIDFMTQHTAIPLLGTIPFISDLYLEEEDRFKASHCPDPEIDIAVVYLPHISNSSDFNPLSLEPNVQVRLVRSPEALGAPDLIILPGTKSTLWDLHHLRQIGWEQALRAHLPTTPIMGICGGFEMMGSSLHDPFRIESEISNSLGFGFFDFTVRFQKSKKVGQVRYRPTPHNIFKDAGEISGYEIHCGELEYGAHDRPMFTSERFTSESGLDGAIAENPLVFGTFIHDIFKNALFTRTLINFLRQRKQLPCLQAPLIEVQSNFEQQIEQLAATLQHHCPL